MSVPLDRLYNHISGLCNHNILIYRFLPHGSKNLKDLKILNSDPMSWFSVMSSPLMVCHDQEPLHIDLYSQKDFDSLGTPAHLANLCDSPFRHITGLPQNTFDYFLLAHSERNSAEVSKFQKQGFIPVYWWAHAAIARDWFRFAKHDTEIKPSIDRIENDFLIYNRAWSGTREYRLKFAELLITHGLTKNCNTKFSPIDSDTHYQDHVYKNPEFKIQTNIEDYIEINTSDSTASADYCSADYATSGIEVVLETLFDDTRHHLTEKILRPIACGKPFILAATPHSLKYLRDYGFKTFDGLIDESYDIIEDPGQRLKAIVKSMKSLAVLSQHEKHSLWQDLNKVAEYNKKLFFSDHWHETIFDEFKTNTNIALKELWKHRTAKNWHRIVAANPNRRFNDPSGKVYYDEEQRQQLISWLAADIPPLQI